MGLFRCLNTLGCPEASLDEACALARRHGLDGVEVRALGGTTDLAGHLAAAFGSPEALAARGKAREPGGRIVAFNASWKLIGGNPADREQLLALVPWAETLGVRWLRVFDGGRSADGAEAAEAAAALQWWRRERAAHGWRVDLMVETHDALVTAAAVRRFLAAAPGTAILWDAHHTWRKGGEDPRATWAAIRESVVHVHVKDSIGVPSARHPFTYVLPGEGEFPMAPLAAELASAGFAGPVSLEWERLWHPYLPPLEQALVAAAARRWW